jgi:hypothetical protein
MTGVEPGTRALLRWLARLFLLLTLTACHTETVTAPGFDEAKFLALSVGNTPQQVVEAIGQPLETWNHWDGRGVLDGIYWSYRKRSSAGSAYHSVVVFSPEWKLVARELEWYDD